MARKIQSSAVITRSNLSRYHIRQKINQILESQQTSDISPSRASYGMSVVGIWEKIDRVITAPRCKWINTASYEGYIAKQRITHICMQIADVHPSILSSHWKINHPLPWHTFIASKHKYHATNAKSPLLPLDAHLHAVHDRIFPQNTLLPFDSISRKLFPVTKITPCVIMPEHSPPLSDKSASLRWGKKLFRLLLHREHLGWIGASC